ncbi:MAG TPA: hypothetical protein VHF25_08210 [Nitriliruptorales bacterium]|nr:hypothetical protein [Nitriliruptorales bacterium]
MSTEATTVTTHGPLLAEMDRAQLWQRWEEIQAGFVDQPQKAVADADVLVLDLLDRIMQVFHDQRQELEHRWQDPDVVTTEDLRQLLQRYRSFFGRLLETA